MSSSWSQASLHDVLRAEFEHAERLALTGPDVLLEPKAFSAMALVTHELATNARKYGALSTAAGRVGVETSVDEIGNVAVSWRETGGPPVSPPTRRGFGSTILEQAIPFEVDGISRPSFRRSGFVF